MSEEKKLQIGLQIKLADGSGATKAKQDIDKVKDSAEQGGQKVDKLADSMKKAGKAGSDASGGLKDMKDAFEAATGNSRELVKLLDDLPGNLARMNVAITGMKQLLDVTFAGLVVAAGTAGFKMGAEMGDLFIGQMSLKAEMFEQDWQDMLARVADRTARREIRFKGIDDAVAIAQKRIDALQTAINALHGAESESVKAGAAAQSAGVRNAAASASAAAGSPEEKAAIKIRAEIETQSIEAAAALKTLRTAMEDLYRAADDAQRKASDSAAAYETKRAELEDVIRSTSLGVSDKDRIKARDTLKGLEDGRDASSKAADAALERARAAEFAVQQKEREISASQKDLGASGMEALRPLVAKMAEAMEALKTAQGQIAQARESGDPGALQGAIAQATNADATARRLGELVKSLEASLAGGTDSLQAGALAAATASQEIVGAIARNGQTTAAGFQAIWRALDQQNERIAAVATQNRVRN